MAASSSRVSGKVIELLRQGAAASGLSNRDLAELLKGASDDKEFIGALTEFAKGLEELRATEEKKVDRKRNPPN
jgi:hypothetical protein